MSLYICPPNNSSCLSTLLKDVNNRLKLLYMISQCNGSFVSVTEQLKCLNYASGSDGYIEHTDRDTNSHFMLKIISSIFPTIEEFLSHSEQYLFLFRLKCNENLLFPLQLLKKEIENAFGTLIIEGGYEDALSLASAVIININQIRCIADRVRCRKCTIKVPWRAVTSLVSSRSVVIRNGICYLLCSQVWKALGELFIKLFKENCSQMSHHDQLGRLKDMYPQLYIDLKRCLSEFLKKYPLDPFTYHAEMPAITAETVHESSVNFPLCMRQLEDFLYNTKRLPHHQRFRYSVFLKDIGLPLTHNILFWEKLYSATPAGHTSCCHSWKKSKSRYTYSIRHIYGLEGRRREAKAYACQQIQNITAQPNQCRGCPFVLSTPMTRSVLLHCNNLSTDNLSQDIPLPSSQTVLIEKSLTNSQSLINVEECDSEPLLKLLKSVSIEDGHCKKIIHTAVKGNANLACKMTLSYFIEKNKYGKRQNISKNYIQSPGISKSDANKMSDVTDALNFSNKLTNEIEPETNLEPIIRSKSTSDLGSSSVTNNSLSKRSLKRLNFQTLPNTSPESKVRKMFARTKSVLEVSPRTNVISFFGKSNIKNCQKSTKAGNTSNIRFKNSKFNNENYRNPYTNADCINNASTEQKNTINKDCFHPNSMDISTKEDCIVINSDTKGEKLDQWFLKAMDTNDSSLLFSSPVQYYAALTMKR